MTVDQALNILNKNSSGRIYSEEEAEKLLNFSTKLAQIAIKHPIKTEHKKKLKVA